MTTPSHSHSHSHRAGTVQGGRRPGGMPGGTPHQVGAEPPAPDGGGTGPRSNIRHQDHRNQPFYPLPRPTGHPPFRLALADILPQETMQAIEQSGRMTFHVVGDTGGVKSPEAQQIVAMHMEADFQPPDPVETPPDAPATTADPFVAPAFFYHLGDVVYYNGETKEYFHQFYEPYLLYPAPILGIPGNHDGAPIDATETSLAAFVTNFCAPVAEPTPESNESRRNAMTQPHVYWTLETPFMTVIGLYTNVPEGGRLDENQRGWLRSELEAADANKFLVIASHHPIFSADDHHSGSAYMLDLLNEACQRSNRTPHLVLTAHVHNYQRFLGPLNGKQVPFIVAGAGGYWHLHYLTKELRHGTPLPYTLPDSGAVLESFCDDRHGYLKMEVTKDAIKGQYFTVPRPQESWKAPAQLLDTFSIAMDGGVEAGPRSAGTPPPEPPRHGHNPAHPAVR